MDWFWLHIGAMASYMRHPMLWFWFSPPRWLLYVGVTASQESGGNPLALNPEEGSPGGNSEGMLQFQQATWASLTDKPDEYRQSPYWSGYYAGDYVQAALLSDFSWWLPLWLPVWGMGAMRRMWRAGIAATDGVWTWSETGAASFAGDRVWPTYLKWIVPALLVLGVFWYALMGTKKAPKVQ